MKSAPPKEIRDKALLIDARAQLQEDFAAAEQKYSDALRALGKTKDADIVKLRAESHAARAQRIRAGVA